MRPLVFALSAVLVLGQTDPSVLAENHVTIPVAEYNRLTDAAAATAKRRVDPPPAYVIRSAEFRLQAEKGIATGVLEIRGEVLAKGAVVIPLVSGLNIRDAQLGGKAIPLVIQGGKHTTVIEGPAEFAIQLGCSRALLNEPGRAGISFPAISAGMVKASVSLPGEETAIQLLPGMMESRSSSGGRTLVKATLVPDKAAQLTWSARLAPPTAPAAPPKPLRFLSDLKTLINVSESDLTMSVLADVTVIQGEASRFELAVPQGFEVAAADGGTIAHTEAKAGSVIVHVTSPSIRSHQFLISLAKPFGADKTGLAIPGLVGAQRETGEVLVEGQGTLELIAKERGGLRRMDLREVSSQLRTLSAASMYAGFRYQKRATESPGVDLEWVRFPAAAVTAALSPKAVVTTLVTREGRSLTEVKLTVRNQSQSFVRVSLPQGASILTADVGGEKVKPVEASDGSRVPLTRPGYRPAGPYTVSFVTVSSGTPFAKRGAGEVALPKLDLPIGAIEWEVLLPQELHITNFSGNATPAERMPQSGHADISAVLISPRASTDVRIGPGQVGGTVTDAAGAVISGVHVTVTHQNGQQYDAISNADGRWAVPRMLPGKVTVRAEAAGFARLARTLDLGPGPLSVALTLQVGSVSETIGVTSGAPVLQTQQSERALRQNAAPPSANVSSLQQRLTGVLPIAVTVPRAGTAYRFIRPLVVDEETKLAFQYRTGK